MKKITYTAEEVHQGFIDAALAYMPKCKALTINEEVRSRLNKLKTIGFDRAKTTIDAETIDEETKQAEFFKFFNTHFPWAIIIEESTFISLLDKYNMCGGTLDNYTGEIPDENIDEILDSVNLLESVKKDNIWSNAEHFIYSHIKLERHESNRSIEILSLLSYLRDDAIFLRENERNEREKAIEDEFASKEFIVASEKLGRYPFKKVIEEVTNSLKYHDLQITLSDKEAMVEATSTDLFIAAPAKDIQNRVKIEYSEKVQAKDPFVFQITPYGVVIFSKWGEEANDVIFK